LTRSRQFLLSRAPAGGSAMALRIRSIHLDAAAKRLRAVTKGSLAEGHVQKAEREDS